MLQELAPLLAEDGIDLNAPDGLGVPDLETLQRAMDRAVERRNLQLFTPAGATRDVAVTALQAIVEAILDDDTARAGDLLDQVQPESPDGSTATVASCIGISLGLLDDWLSGHDTTAPAGLGDQTRLPAGHWNGGRAATDIRVPARKGRAFRSMDKVMVRRGGKQVLAGSVLALAAATGTRARLTGTPVPDAVASLIH